MTNHSPIGLRFQVPALTQAEPAKSLQAHQIAYTRYGDVGANHIVICVHGLTRRGSDFDILARSLIHEYEIRGKAVQVICPDVVGRGDSDWLKNPSQYQLPTYAYGLKCLLDQLCFDSKVTSLDWVGTSMGGLIGMLVGGLEVFHLHVPIRRLVLNDVGPVVQWQFIERLKTYLGVQERFDSVQAGVEKLAQIYKSFGPHSAAQWQALSVPMLKPLGAGGWLFHYDPLIAEPVRAMTPQSASQAEAAMWSIYDNIKAETLLIRGVDSDLLTMKDALEMSARGPRAKLTNIEGVGHAPTLVQEDQLKILKDFLIS